MIRFARAMALGAALTLLHAAPAVAFQIDEKSFRCLTRMTPVRGFYVDNLLGPQALKETLAVARSPQGGVYPAGSVVQLVPGEAMVKLPAGSSPVTKDWEYFELDVSPAGTRIAKRGFADVFNRFGGNCFSCHVQAKPQWDSICEQDHGCLPIPLTPAMSRALQRADPRCQPPNALSPDDLAALKQLGELMKAGRP